MTHVTLDRTTAHRELLLIGTLAVLQPITELILGATAAHYYNYIALCVGLAYVLRSAKRNPSLWKAWGIRTDNFRSAILPHLALAACGAIFLYVYGTMLGNTPLPLSFFIILPLYVAWGFAQQFALQNLVIRNAALWIPSITLRATIIALLFGTVHLPSMPLAVLAAAFGFCITLVYNARPNMFAAGIAHGIVGSLVFYVILGKDQWQVILRYFS